MAVTHTIQVLEIISYVESVTGRVPKLIACGSLGRADQLLDSASDALRRSKTAIRRAEEAEEGFRLKTTTDVHES